MEVDEGVVMQLVSRVFNMEGCKIQVCMHECVYM